MKTISNAVKLIAQSKTAWDFGWEYAEFMQGEEGFDKPVNIEEIIHSSVESIPSGGLPRDGRSRY